MRVMVKGPKGGKRERTRQRLVDATLQIIAEHGFEAVSVEEIAARAGVTTGSIYSNYRSKADLLWDATQRRALRLDVKLATGVPLTTQARAIARAVIALMPQSRASADFHRDLQLHLRADPELWRRQAAQYREMFDAFAQRLTALHGDELAIDARYLAIAVQALIWGYITQWMQSPEEITEDVVAAGFEALARGASKPQAGRG
jgi:AcrR family transcriptional regulator